MRYRRDVDGLRTVAVVPVILSHAGLSLFGGGFVGVDVFFVISGFLITSLIAEEIREGRFSLLSFYERRVRRILPALAAVLLVSWLLGAAILLPNDFREFAGSVAAAAVSVSNIFFWRQSGYFDDQAAFKPLLHTWSLAVEEQFYIFFPLFLLLVWRFARGRWTVALLPVLAASFALAAWGVAHKPDAAFFLAPTRAWELLLGALLAVGAVPPLRSRILAEGAGLLGLGLIGWSVLTFHGAMEFPGVNALYPCLGAALLIHSGTWDTATARLLSTRPMVFTGRISYSLYLWHWPLLVFAGYLAFRPLTGWETAGVIAATVLLSVLSWRYVEQPFRRGAPLLPGRRRVFAGAAAALLLACLAGAHGLTTGGWTGRFAPQVAEVSAVAGMRDPAALACQDRKPADIAQGRLCVIGAPEAQETWLYWGDSHAIAFQHLYDEALRAAGKKALVVGYNGCAPLFGIHRADYPLPCHAVAEAVKALIDRTGIRTVVMTAFWTGYYHDTVQSDGSGADTAAVLDAAVARTLRDLAGQGVRLHLADPVPGARHNVPRAMAASLAWHRPINSGFTAAEYLERNRRLLAAIEQNGASLHARLSLWRRLCGEGTCRYGEDGLPLYFDDNHPAKGRFAFAREDIRRFVAGGSALAAKPE